MAPEGPRPKRLKTRFGAGSSSEKRDRRPLSDAMALTLHGHADYASAITASVRLTNPAKPDMPAVSQLGLVGGFAHQPGDFLRLL